MEGKYIFKNGDQYEGEFENDLFHGDGVFTFNHGDKYEGQFKKIYSKSQVSIHTVMVINILANIE